MMKIPIFWDITPCSPLKVNRRFWGTCRLHLQGRGRALFDACFMLASCLGYSSTLKMEICSSETSVDFQRNTLCYIPEDILRHNYRHENLKFCIYIYIYIYIYTHRIFSIFLLCSNLSLLWTWSFSCIVILSFIFSYLNLYIWVLISPASILISL
jgi:hypothetical protein